jgi:cell division protease FtsH
MPTLEEAWAPIFAENREATAYHEAGHALAMLIWNGGLESVSIAPDPRAGHHGITSRRGPPLDFVLTWAPWYRRQHLHGEARVNVAGYAAEEVFTGKRPGVVVQTLAVWPRSWRAAAAMGRAMSESDGAEEEEEPGTDLGDALQAMALAYPRDTRSATLKRVASEYGLVIEFLTAHRSALDALAAALLREETLDRNRVEETCSVDYATWIFREMARPMPRGWRRAAET